MTDNKKVMQAVRDLRSQLGRTQTQFAEMINVGMSTVQRYEQLVPPKGRILVRLMELAEQHGYVTEARVFANALAEELDARGASNRPLGMLLGGIPAEKWVPFQTLAGSLYGHVFSSTIDVQPGDEAGQAVKSFIEKRKGALRAAMAPSLEYYFESVLTDDEHQSSSLHSKVLERLYRGEQPEAIAADLKIDESEVSQMAVEFGGILTKLRKKLRRRLKSS